MALVDDDQVKKSWRKLPEELLALLRPGDGLVQAEIDLIGGVDAALLVERRGELNFGAILRARWSSASVLSLAIAAPNGRKSFTIV